MSIYIIRTSADDPINTLNVNRTHVISRRFRVIILVRLVLQSPGDSCNGNTLDRSALHGIRMTTSSKPPQIAIHKCRIICTTL